MPKHRFHLLKDRQFHLTILHFSGMKAKLQSFFFTQPPLNAGPLGAGHWQRRLFEETRLLARRPLLTCEPLQTTDSKAGVAESQGPGPGFLALIPRKNGLHHLSVTTPRTGEPLSALSLSVLTAYRPSFLSVLG